MATDWITLSQTGGTGDCTVSISASDNPYAIERHTRVVITGRDITKSIPILQWPAPLRLYEIYFTNVGGIYLPYTGGTATTETLNYTVRGRLNNGTDVDINEDYLSITGDSKTISVISTGITPTQVDTLSLSASYSGESATTVLTATTNVPVYVNPAPEERTIAYSSSTQIRNIPSGWSSESISVVASGFDGTNGTIIFDNPVTIIPSEAFSGQSGLTMVRVPSQVELISTAAFDGCTNLETLVYNGTMINWSNITLQSAWKYNSSIRYIQCTDGTIDLAPAPNVIMYLAENKIPEDNINYSNFNVPASAENHIFSNGQGVIEFTPIGLEEVNGYGRVECSDDQSGSTFYMAVQLEEVTFPNNVYALTRGLSWCPKLKKINISDNIGIFDYPTTFCFMLGSIKIPNGVTHLKGGLFTGCFSLSSVTIPTSVTSIGEQHYGPFYGCPNLKHLNYEGTCEQWNQIQINNLHAYPSAFCQKLFEHKTLIEDVICTDGRVILDGVSNDILPITAWNEFVLLKKNDLALTIANEDSMYVQSNGYAVTNFLSPSYATTATEARLVSETIPSNGFSGFTNLSSVTIASSVKYFGQYCFVNSPLLSAITYEGTMYQWNNSVYFYAYIDFPLYSYVRYINCSDGTIDLWKAEPSLSGNVISFICEKDPHSGTSDGTVRLNKFTPANPSLTNYGCYEDSYYQDLYGYPVKTVLSADTNFTKIGEKAMYNLLYTDYFNFIILRSVSLPNTITEIGTSAFTDNSYLFSINIPTSLEILGDYAFKNTKIRLIELPTSLTSIGRGVFSQCTFLTEITYKGTIAQWNNITKDANWNIGSSITVIHCTDGDISV